MGQPEEIKSRKDLLLVLLFSPGKEQIINEPIIGRTKLIKAIFLFNKEIWKKFKGDISMSDDMLYQFFPWNYGPFSKQVYDDITFFILSEFLRVEVTNGELIVEEAAEWSYWLDDSGIESEYNEFNEEAFKLTEKGVQFAESLYKGLTKNQQNLLQEFKSRIQSIPLRALLKYVYTTYPDQTVKSQIVNKIV